MRSGHPLLATGHSMIRGATTPAASGVFAEALRAQPFRRASRALAMRPDGTRPSISGGTRFTSAVRRR